MPFFNFSKNLFTAANGELLAISDNDKLELTKPQFWFGLPLEKNPPQVAPKSPLGELSQFGFSELPLLGAKVLVIGARDGFFAFLAESLGAGEVWACDEVIEDGRFDSARSLGIRILGSKVRFLPFSEIYRQKYDIIISIDALTRVPAPLSFLEEIYSQAPKHLLVINHVLPQTDALPANYLLRNYGSADPYLERHGITVPWLIHALDQVGFILGKGNSFSENRMVAIKAERGFSRASFAPIKLEELRDDRGLEHDTTVLVMSCKKFEQVWDPFFKLFKRYWKTCPYRVVLCTDFGNYPGVETIELGKDFGWPGNCKRALEILKVKRVILFQEDFLLDREVEEETVRKLLRHSIDFGVGCLRLAATPGPTGKWFASELLGTIAPLDDYRLSLQLAIWDSAVLQALLLENESPWQLELQGSARAAIRPEPFLSLWPAVPAPVSYYMTAVVKGEWQEGALELLRREGIETEHIKKKIQ